MNYLAHAYLSFNNPGVLTGNMINDYVKGKSQYDYPEIIQKGLQLHRFIDRFTDIHPATAEAKVYFQPAYRLYSGAFIDIVYDHFLAIDESQFEPYGGLQAFSNGVYKQLDETRSYFPFIFGQMYPYMREQNWLFNYHTRQGIQMAFKGLVRRAKYLSESEIGFEVFQENYSALQKCYEDFFPELKKFAFEKFTQLIEK